jgi:hypothetical protein
MRYGPPDATERAALADTMVARKADLERQFPAAARRVRERQGRADPPNTARVTAAEQERVEQSRVNGYGFSTDKDQVEDNMVVVHALQRSDGSDATRGWLKLTPEAAKVLQERIIGSTDRKASIDLTLAKKYAYAAFREVALRAVKKKGFDAASTETISMAVELLKTAIAQLSEVPRTVENIAEFDDALSKLWPWLSRLQKDLHDAKNGQAAQRMQDRFDPDQFPDLVSASIQAQSNGSLTWKKISEVYKFSTSKFSRSFARDTDEKWRVDAIKERYEATLPDGTKVTYFPPDRSKVDYAFQGVMQIDAPGKSISSTSRIFEALQETGVEAVRSSELDRRHLYLNAFARLRLVRQERAADYDKFRSITDKGEQGIKEKIALLKKTTGVDVEASEGWRRAEGVHQAFGHGRAYQLRPDLDTPEFDAFEKSYTVFHNPSNLGEDGGYNVFEKLKPVLEGGGIMASLTDRMRRGIPLTGASVDADLRTGGGNYVFTRIFSKRKKLGAGVFWKPRVLKRMDAITYGYDHFGDTTPGFLERNREGATVQSFKDEAMKAKNETIFKAGLSLFDDLDKIVLKTTEEVDDAIKWMQGKGYSTWPDGRKLSEVILVQN